MKIKDLQKILLKYEEELGEETPVCIYINPVDEEYSTTSFIKTDLVKTSGDLIGLLLYEA